MLSAMAKRTARALGFDVRRVRKPSDSTIDEATPYLAALHSILSSARAIVIVEVGANDGVINDPIFPFVKAFPDRTRVVLFEPQPDLIPVLSKNYAFHGQCRILNEAIGAEPELVLYRVKDQYRDMLKPTYASQWPAYRAASGVTSSSRSHVEAWIRSVSAGKVNVESAIESIRVRCSKLPAVLDRIGLSRKVHVLQVDTEGADDEVIYACDIGETEPNLIHFEASHLPEERASRLLEFLRAHGYKVFADRLDWLAIRSLADG